MQVSITQFKANFSALAKQVDAGVDLVITSRGKLAYRLLPVHAEMERAPFPDVTALAMQSKPSTSFAVGAVNAQHVPLVHGSFVAVWRTQNERF